MPGNIGLPEIAIVLVIVLIIFGPKRLPELGQSLGRGIREFKGSLTGDHDDKPIVTEIDEGESAKVETTVTATPVDSDKSPESSTGS
ncbi:MAG: Sec-independent protein translocase subunit TatA/TatB [Solirubrobacterales bacterium]